MLKNNNLKVPIGHYGVDDYLTDKNNNVLKNRGWEKLADKFNEAALLCKQARLKLACHNHDFEF